jgi:hypothetical protein
MNALARKHILYHTIPLVLDELMTLNLLAVLITRGSMAVRDITDPSFTESTLENKTSHLDIPA